MGGKPLTVKGSLKVEKVFWIVIDMYEICCIGMITLYLRERLITSTNKWNVEISDRQM